MQAFRSNSDTSVGARHPLTGLKFAELPLTSGVQAGIRSAGFEFCTPIQQAALPIALEGRDVAGQAQTGTGKTAAYLIAMFQRFELTKPPEDRAPSPRALILAPTRELAVQIHSDAVALLAELPYKLALAYGGIDYDKQRRRIADGVDVLIGTPGRIIDYYKQRVFTFKRTEVLVLDEADRMFDLGFIKDIRYVLRRLPERDKRLNMLFSATLSHRVLELAYEHMNDPELVRIDPDKITVDGVTQRIYFPANDEKLGLLIMLLREMEAKRTMVFVNMKREADRVRDGLRANGINAEAISGDVPQRKRERMLKDFQSGDLPVLIGTDVASRGLHVPSVSHVFNYDLPQDAEDYVHRIGRTARAGASGDAISFGCENYVTALPEIEDYIGYKIPVVEVDRAALEERAKTLKSARPQGRRHPPRGRPAGNRRGGPSRGASKPGKSK